MARITIISTGLAGIFNASLALATRLGAAGHTVQLATPRDHGDRATEEGVVHHRLSMPVLDPTPSLPEELDGVHRVRRWRYRWEHRRRLRAAALESLKKEDFRDWIRENQPDLVLLDVEMHEFIFYVHATGIPYLLLSQWYNLWERSNLPYLLTDSVPGHGWRGSRFGIRLHWQLTKGKRWWTFARQRWRSAGTDRRSTLLILSRELGFPRRHIRQNFWPGPFTYTGVPLLAMATKALEFPRNYPSWLHYVGPMVLPDRKEPPANSHRGTPASALVAARKLEGGPLLLVTLSTMRSARGDFLEKILAAVTNRPEWRVVIGLGGRDPERLGAIPENVELFSFVPQLEFLAVADLSINHGGVHTIHECIHFEVPMLVYSGKKSDQNGCAARVHYHGIGLMADRDRDSPDEIGRKIDHLLETPAYRERIREMRKTVEAELEEGRLERVVGDFSKVSK